MGKSSLYRCVHPDCSQLCDHSRQVLCLICQSTTPPEVVRQVVTATIQFRQCYPCFRDRYQEAVGLLKTQSP